MPSQSTERGRPSAARGAGFTLAELVIALGVTALLLSSAAVVLRSTMTELDRGIDATSSARRADDLADRLTADLQVATHVDRSKAGATSLTVPDRNKDGVDDTIDYAYNATDKLLTRSINGAASSSERADTYELTPGSRPGPLVATLTSQTLASHTVVAAGTKLEVESTAPVAIVVTPTMPTGATGWWPSTLRIFIRRTTGSGSALLEARVVALYAFDLPNMSRELATGSVPLSAISNNSTPSIALTPSNATPLTPGQRVAIILSVSASGPSVELGVTAGGFPGALLMLQSKDSGMTWQPLESARLTNFALVGSVTTRSEQ